MYYICFCSLSSPPLTFSLCPNLPAVGLGWGPGLSVQHISPKWSGTGWWSLISPPCHLMRNTDTPTQTAPWDSVHSHCQVLSSKTDLSALSSHSPPAAGEGLWRSPGTVCSNTEQAWLLASGHQTQYREDWQHMAFLLWLPFPIKSLEGDKGWITQGSRLDVIGYERAKWCASRWMQLKINVDINRHLFPSV